MNKIPSFIDFSHGDPYLNYMRFTLGSNIALFFEE